MARLKLRSKLVKSYWITLFIGVTLAYFIWLTWNKLTDYIGDSDMVWLITGGIVLVSVLLGMFSFKKIAERFI